MKKNNHFDNNGNAQMIDISNKEITARKAIAAGKIKVSQEVIEIIESKSNKKGDVLGVARIAGIQAAKRTADIIPLAHQLNISKIKITFALDQENTSILCNAEVVCTGKTGVEIEALHAVQISLLTIYDMCKYLHRGMEISDIHLISKEGGKSGSYLFK